MNLSLPGVAVHMRTYPGPGGGVMTPDTEGAEDSVFPLREVWARPSPSPASEPGVPASPPSHSHSLSPRPSSCHRHFQTIHQGTATPESLEGQRLAGRLGEGSILWRGGVGAHTLKSRGTGAPGLHTHLHNQAASDPKSPCSLSMGNGNCSSWA